MKMNFGFKFIDSFIKDNISYVKIKFRDHIYTGKAKCCEDDSFSNFTGCRYAEERAEIQALKDLWKQKKTECEACRKMIKCAKTSKDFDSNSSTAKAIYRQFNGKVKEVNALADEINNREFSLKTAIRMQDRLNDKISKKG